MPQLIEAICRADRDALALLFDRQVDRVYAIALAMLSSREEAEDVCSEVFEKIWRRAEGFDAGRGSAESWIGAITRNACLDRLRRRSRNPEISMAQPEDGVPVVDPERVPGPEQWVDRTAFRHAVVAAMDRLSEAQRRVVRLAFVQGLTHREIAHRLKLPLGTVKSHCRRGLSTMRLALTRHDPANR